MECKVIISVVCCSADIDDDQCSTRRILVPVQCIPSISFVPTAPLRHPNVYIYIYIYNELTLHVLFILNINYAK